MTLSLTVTVLWLHEVFKMCLCELIPHLTRRPYTSVSFRLSEAMKLSVPSHLISNKLRPLLWYISEAYVCVFHEICNSSVLLISLCVLFIIIMFL